MAKHSSAKIFQVRDSYLIRTLPQDGARIGNAVYAMDCDISEMTWKCGVDVLTFGGRMDHIYVTH